MIQAIKDFKFACVVLGVIGTLFSSEASYSYPVFAQNAYANPREATGRIVCANCHLEKMSIEVEVPQAVLADTLFEAVVDIPYDVSLKQISDTYKKATFKIGSVLILPESFRLAPKERLSDEIKAKTKGVFVQPYSKEKPNILVVGPVAGAKGGVPREIVFPLLSPKSTEGGTERFLNYPIYVGGNSGRGQVYPTGEKSNNNGYAFNVDGKVQSLTAVQTGGKSVIVEATDSWVDRFVPEVKKTYDERLSKDTPNVRFFVETTIPKGLQVAFKVKDNVKSGQALALDPNVGGFGQEETEIVLQKSDRVKNMIIFIFTVTLVQIFLILKKKQFEKVQIGVMNFK